MKTVNGFGNHILVTVAAGPVGIDSCGISHHSFVGCLPVRVARVAAVADFAGNLTVLGFEKGWFDVNFLVKLQRSKRAASPFTGCFSRMFWLRFDLFDLPAKPNELFQI